MEENSLARIDPKMLGTDLQDARKKANLNQEEAAQALGLSRTTVTAIEAGKRSISPDELIILAELYGKRVSDFVRQRPQINPFMPQFRGPSLRNAQDEEKIAYYVNALEDLCRDYLELEQIVNAPLNPDYPPIYELKGGDLESEAAVLADRERRRLGLGDAPIPRFREILEHEVGLRVFYLDMQPSSYSAIYIYDHDMGGCIGINRLHPEERRRWSLAHDYAHFLAHRFNPTLFVEAGYQRVPKDERFADRFAAHFLMPDSSVLRQLGKLLHQNREISMAGLLSLANYFGVSLAAMVLRLEDMNKIQKGTWESIRESGFRVRDAQEELGLPVIAGSDQLLPLRYQYLAATAYSTGTITEGQLAGYLRVDRLQAREMLEALRRHAGGITDETRFEINFDYTLQ